MTNQQPQKLETTEKKQDPQCKPEQQGKDNRVVSLVVVAMFMAWAALGLVSHAQAQCGPGAGNCCASNGSPGCEDVGCCACICGCDPFCCNTSWDSLCAGQGVAGFCGASNPNGTCAAECSFCLPVICTRCKGDLDESGSVDVGDLLALLGCWGPVGPGSNCTLADLDHNGSVGVFDILQLLGSWGPCGWTAGDLVSYTQGAWKTNSTAHALLIAHYNSVYAPTSGVLLVGIPGAGGFFSLIFTSATAVLSYLPSLGPPAPLNSNLLNPTSTSSGTLGGNVVALKLNIDFSDAGWLVGASPTTFGDLKLCNFDALPALNGLSVREFLGIANTVLGGGTAIYPLAAIAPITLELSFAFQAGAVSPFAQTHLFSSTCPSCP